jgi:hypothetical protein
MIRISAAGYDSEDLDQPVAGDVLLRQEPDDEDDEKEGYGIEKEDDEDDETDEGYSE